MGRQRHGRWANAVRHEVVFGDPYGVEARRLGGACVTGRVAKRLTGVGARELAADEEGVDGEPRGDRRRPAP